MLDIARVSRSGFYKWYKRKDAPDKDYNDYLLVKAAFEKGRKKLGYRRIKMKLHAEGVVMNHKKIMRIKLKYRLVTKIRRRNTNQFFKKMAVENRTFPNILNRDFSKNTPYTFFSTDITYLPYRAGRAYLSVVKDIASGEAISYEVSQNMDMPIVTNTLEKMQHTLSERNVSTRGIHIHSDQGTQYKCPSYFNTIRSMGMIQSMSRKGNCLDNATIESFFGHLKDEIEIKRCSNLAEVTSIVDEYMKYYNTDRHQWNRKKMTPVEYRNHLLELARA